MNELLPLVAAASVIFGVLLSIAKGYNGRPDGERFQAGKLISSLIIGVMGTLSVSMLLISFLTDQLNSLGYAAFVFTFIMQGYGTDQGLSFLDKNRR